MSEIKRGRTIDWRRVGEKAGEIALRTLGVGVGVAIVATGVVAAGYEVLSALSVNTIPSDELGDLIRNSSDSGAVDAIGGFVQVVTTPLAWVSDQIPNTTGADHFSETVAEVAIGSAGAVLVQAGGTLAVSAAVD